MMGSGRDREIRYGEGSPWFDIVLPCGGGITLTLHKLRSAQPLLAVLNRLEQRKPAGCATIRSTIAGVPAHANPNGLESQWL
ncbi:xanthine dehydrogenase accessory factor [Escherichia coli]|uniref:Xanthine dehydrogenase accessory factor n=1 Tax=Escherichia coli TaxID=562 RepID=A0A376U2W4_ECOLX|nr:xanthine dehydrogenase accessory factor [Escherichia coli]